MVFSRNNIVKNSKQQMTNLPSDILNYHISPYLSTHAGLFTANKNLYRYSKIIRDKHEKNILDKIINTTKICDNPCVKINPEEIKILINLGNLVANDINKRIVLFNHPVYHFRFRYNYNAKDITDHIIRLYYNDHTWYIKSPLTIIIKNQLLNQLLASRKSSWHNIPVLVNGTVNEAIHGPLLEDAKEKAYYIIKPSLQRMLLKNPDIAIKVSLKDFPFGPRIGFEENLRPQASISRRCIAALAFSILQAILTIKDSIKLFALSFSFILISPIFLTIALIDTLWRREFNEIIPGLLFFGKLYPTIIGMNLMTPILICQSFINGAIRGYYYGAFKHFNWHFTTTDVWKYSYTTLADSMQSYKNKHPEILKGNKSAKDQSYATILAKLNLPKELTSKNDYIPEEKKPKDLNIKSIIPNQNIENSLLNSECISRQPKIR